MHIVSRPMVTEKTMTLAQKGWFTFAVALSGSKHQIAREVEKLYTVNVVDVRTAIRPGKARRRGRKQMVSRSSNTKKAMVQLKSGQTIPAFEVASETEKK